MCGIAGFLTPAGGPPREDWPAILRTMGESIQHRGPDDCGVWVHPDSGVGLVHRRLSILDLSPAGHQPMRSSSGRFLLVFNGEIYNHLDLRRELAERGQTPAWRGHSDTETLLTGFETWGVKETLQRAVGMFAFGLWDAATGELYLARDRFGEKPLYYAWSKGSFLFGSDLKALRSHPSFERRIDPDVVALFLRYGYVPAPHAIYRHTYKLEPGCILTVAAGDAGTAPSQAPFAPLHNGTFRIERFWSLGDVVRAGLAHPFSDPVEATVELEAVLKRSVKEQSVADVPLGAFLSGGVDSSTIVALMQAQSSQKVHTFTIGFSEAAFNEAVYAKAVAAHLGTQHTELYVSASEARTHIPLLASMYSEPFADSSQLPTFLVSRLARQHVTVALSGDAGDELFGGYNRYFWGRRVWKQVQWMPAQVRRALGHAAARIPEAAWDRIGHAMPRQLRVHRFGQKARRMGERLAWIRSPDDLYRSLVCEWGGAELVPGARRLRTLLDDPDTVSQLRNPEERMMFWDARTYLPDDILQKVDRASMAVSLETRAPFLDHRVAELAWRIPLHMKMRDGQGKWVLRQVLHRHVPRHLIERPKTGFGIPVGQWLSGPLRDWAEELLEPGRLEGGGLLRAAPIRSAWKQHLSGSHDWTGRLWSVLMLQAWLEQETA